MKKIGLMTLHHDKSSYGACLQGFALWHYLSQNNDCEMVNMPVTKNKEHEETLIIHIKVFVAKCLIFLKNFLNPKYLKALRDSKARIQNFETFNSLIKMSKKCWTKEEIYQNPPSYDVWVSGSDQLWNPRIYFDIEPYLLGFTREEDKRISYASSLGVLEIEANYEQLFKYAIPRFHSIAMREASAIPVIQRFTNIKIENVLDPTFLLSKDEWRNFAKPIDVQKKYLICYFLSYTSEVISFCKEQAESLGLIPFFISTKAEDTLQFPDSNFIQNAGPSEFIYLLDNSDFVLTDSFHGTVFSIIFEKQFITYIGKNIKASSRITNMLTSLGIPDNVLSRLQVKDSNIDYAVVRKFLAKRITESKDYLNKSIG